MHRLVWPLAKKFNYLSHTRLLRYLRKIDYLTSTIYSLSVIITLSNLNTVKVTIHICPLWTFVYKYTKKPEKKDDRFTLERSWESSPFYVFSSIKVIQFKFYCKSTLQKTSANSYLFNCAILPKCKQMLATSDIIIARTTFRDPYHLPLWRFPNVLLPQSGQNISINAPLKQAVIMKYENFQVKHIEDIDCVQATNILTWLHRIWTSYYSSRVWW